MKRFVYRLVIFGFLCFPMISSAQGENNQWCFARNYGLNFNTTPPAFFETNMQVLEGSASICDAAGNLLFYSSGAYTWDRLGNLMPNGQDLNGNGPQSLVAPFFNVGSSLSGVAIVPSPSNSNQYYLLVTDAADDQLNNAYYSVIDMTLNGGFGDVNPTQKNILLSTGVTEGVITTNAGGCSEYWAVLHSLNSSEYLAFKIDNNGVSVNPVVSNGLPGNSSSMAYGHMRFNNKGTRIVRGRETAEFDKITGIFSSFFTLEQIGWGWWWEFSPDDSKLYNNNYGTELAQFNLSLLPDTTAVQNSRQIIYNDMFVAKRLGPDNKIYLTTLSSDSLHVINNPNALGAACQLSMNAIPMPLPFNAPNYTPLVMEFGSKSPTPIPVDTIFLNTNQDTLVCFEQQVTLNGSEDYQSYRWFSGNTSQQETVYQDGTYWLHGVTGCELHIDSFSVHFINFPLDLGADTIICDGSQLLLDATTPDAAYRWQDNSTMSTYAATAAGMYKVKVTVGNCSNSDSMLVNVINPFVNITENDTIICKNEPFNLHGTAYPEGTYLWSTGESGNNISIHEKGTYILTASNICGDLIDSVNIETMDCFCDAFMPNAFSPNGDGTNDVINAELNCPGMTAFTLKIFNRFGQCVFISNDLNKA